MNANTNIKLKQILLNILLILLGVLDFWGYDDYLYMSCLS